MDIRVIRWWGDGGTKNAGLLAPAFLEKFGRLVLGSLGCAFDRADGGTLFDGDGFLALPAAEVVEAGAADFAEAGDFNFGDLWGVQGEDALDAFSIRDFADGISGVEAGSFAGDDETGVNLDPFLVTFDNAAVDFDGVSDTELWDVRFELLLFEFGDGVHGLLSVLPVSC